MTDPIYRTEGKPLASLNFVSDYGQLPSLLHRSIVPTPLADPSLISVNHKLCEQLQISTAQLDTDLLTQWIAGHKLPDNCQPLAMKYTGHQFGHYNPELGDGRGLLLGEQRLDDGSLVDWHLKGAGRTPFSRFGDGRAVLRSTIREYLVGEALHHLGIPTTRAIGMIASTEQAQREELEQCASLIRITPCHIRFGHFEYLYYSRKWTELKELADYVIDRYFIQHPDCTAERDNLNSEIPYIRYRALLTCVIKVSATMVAGWQTYGFLHGVMNSDNMSIIGETFDHGPFAFIDRFDWQAVYNHTDSSGRYAFGKQPDIMLWNLSCLAQALLPLLTRDSDVGELSDIDRKEIEQLLSQFKPTFKQNWYNRTAKRLGIDRSIIKDSTTIDHLIDQWHNLLNQHKVDFQRLYRDITDAIRSPQDPTQANTDQQDRIAIDWQKLCYWQKQDWFSELEDWIDQFLRFSNEIISIQPQAASQKLVMENKNPVYVLRSHITQIIIDAAEQKDYSLIKTWLTRLQQPFLKDDNIATINLHAPDNKKAITLSCSS